MKKKIEYLIIITAIILLIYGGYSIMDYKYKYLETEGEISDLINMTYPSSSEYTVSGNTLKFRNMLYDFYDMDVSKLASSDRKVSNLLNHYNKVNTGTVDYKDENHYVVTMEFEDDNGFKYHSMIIPVDSFDGDSLKFTKDCDVFLFDGNNRDFVVEEAFRSQVAL